MDKDKKKNIKKGLIHKNLYQTFIFQKISYRIGISETDRIPMQAYQV
jgi:hypothetical protein